jgi:hypothetical protein
MTPEGGIVKPEETAVARQRLCKHVSAATDTHVTIEEILEAMFYMSFVSRPSGKVRQSWLGVAAVRNCDMILATT